MLTTDIFRLDGKKAVITGASKGIGEAIAYALARQGADIFIIARNEEKLKTVAKNIQATGRRCGYCSADLGNPDSIDAINTAITDFGGVDCYINNAAFTLFETPMQSKAQSIDSLFNTNYRGSILMVQAIAKQMMDKKAGGSIVFVTSINALSALPSQAVYSSTKAALESMMKSFAAELAPHKIRVNSIAPGAIMTDMNAHFNSQKLKEMSEKIPLGRVGMPEEIADVAAFLSSDAARYMTGSTLVADGGYLLRR